MRSRASRSLGKTKFGSDLRAYLHKIGQPPKLKWLRTGIHPLDLLFGNGIPLGRIIEIYGDESAGKTLLAWEIGKAFDLIVFFDMERATSPKFIKNKLGVDLGKLILREPNTIEDLEQDFVRIHKRLMKFNPNLRVCYIQDSVAASLSKREFVNVPKEGLVPRENTIGARALAMNNFISRILEKMSGTNCVFLALNQLREKIGVMFGDKITTPGGRALKYYSSIRLQLIRGTRLTRSGDKPYGALCNAFIKKNKCAQPFRKTKLKISWEHGMSKYTGLINLLEDAGRIKKVGPGKYKYQNQRFKEAGLKKIIGKNPELLEAWL